MKIREKIGNEIKWGDEKEWKEGNGKERRREMPS